MDEAGKLRISFRTALYVAMGMILAHGVVVLVVAGASAFGARASLFMVTMASGLATLGLAYGLRHSRDYGRLVKIAWSLLTVAQLAAAIGAALKTVVVHSVVISRVSVDR